MQQADSTSSKKQAITCGLTPVRPRAVLSKSEVIEIFNARLTLKSATKVAGLYRVSEKAIRDIWTGRTWAAETWHLDMSRPLKVKPSGRPLGSRDSKPRKQRKASEGNQNSKTSGGNSEANIPHSSRGDLCLGSEQFSACSNCQNSPETAFGLTPIHTWSYDPGCYYHGNDDYRSDHSCSLDEQLLEWEYGYGSGILSDPFEADWSPSFYN